MVIKAHIDSSRGINVKQHSIQCFSKQKSHSRHAVSREISASRVFRYMIAQMGMLVDTTNGYQLSNAQLSIIFHDTKVRLHCWHQILILIFT